MKCRGTKIQKAESADHWADISIYLSLAVLLHGGNLAPPLSLSSIL